MAHPREQCEFIHFYEVQALYGEYYRHVEFLTTYKLAEEYIEKWTAGWTDEVIWKDPIILCVPVLTKLPDFP